MQIEELVPFWAKLTKEEQEELKNRILVQNVKKGTIIHPEENQVFLPLQ